MELPNTSDKQLNTLLHLYKFHYLNTNQIQKLFKHKDPQTVQFWLQDLRKKGYIDYRDFDRKKFIANTKPAIYFLTKVARRKLKTHPKCEIAVLNRVYQEKGTSDNFVNRHIFIADIFLNLRAQIEKDEKLHFSTQANLKGFYYFPKPMPNAYISIKSPKKTKRYFLILINERLPWYLLDKIFEDYLKYTDNNQWSDYSRDPLPSFLIVCPSQKTKKHLFKFICKEMPSTPFYLATKVEIERSGFKGSAWQKVQ
ncbi:replication-relaxation family protein [Candidatus Curtissbacteria bacterium]|nr:replication-relaxation family protein [Candidatus Curtissbacteria bacterium]